MAAISESVASSACLLHVDQHLPDLATVLEDLEGAPVDSVDLLVLTIRNSGHSKWENSDWQLHACLLADARLRVQLETLTEVFAAEPTADKDVLSIDLCSTESLPGLDGCWNTSFVLDLDLCPVRLEVLQALLDIETFDRADVALAEVRDASEDIDKLIVELAAGVVVPAVDHQAEIDPIVLLRVVELSLPGRKLDVFAGA